MSLVDKSLKHPKLQKKRRVKRAKAWIDKVRAEHAKTHPNAGKKWGKPFKDGNDPRRGKNPKGSGPVPREVRAMLLKEFVGEQPLVKARMRLPTARPADHVKYLDLLGKYSLGVTATMTKTDGTDVDAPGKLSKDQIMSKLTEILDGGA